MRMRTLHIINNLILCKWWLLTETLYWSYTLFFSLMLIMRKDSHYNAYCTCITYVQYLPLRIRTLYLKVLIIQ